MIQRLFRYVFSLLAWASPLAAAAQEARVDLELALERTASAADAPRWLRRLEPLGLDGLRIASSDGGPVEIKKLGSGDAPTYLIRGRVTRGARLVVPGKSFAPSQMRAFGEYIDRLRGHGPGRLLADKTDFGLTAEELDFVREQLSRVLQSPVSGLSAYEAVSTLARQIELPVVSDAAKEEELKREEAEIRDELRGLSIGAALAAAVRPAGLAVLPMHGDEGLELQIVSPAEEGVYWPIGRAPEEPAGKLIPQLTSYTTAAVNDVSLREVLTAIGKRLGTPVLFDHNAVEAVELDLGQAITLDRQRMLYVTLLKRVCIAGKVKYELRVDEARQPFLWVSPIQKAF